MKRVALSVILLAAGCVTTSPGRPDAAGKSSRETRGKSSAGAPVVVRAVPKQPAHIIRLYGHWDAVVAATLSPDGSRALTGSADHTAKLWDLKSQTATAHLRGHRESVDAVALSADGLFAVTGSRDGRVIVWDAASGAPVRTLDAGSVVTAVAIAQGGGFVLAGDRDGRIMEWEGPTAVKVTRSVRAHAKTVSRLEVSNDGRFVASASDDGSAGIWQISTLKMRRRLKGHVGWLTAVAFSSDGQRLATGGADGTARVWSVKKGRELVRLKTPDGTIHALKFTGGDRLLLVGSSRLRVIGTGDGRQTAAFTGHGHPILAITVGRDGRPVSVGADETARYWEAVLATEAPAAADKPTPAAGRDP